MRALPPRGTPVSVPPRWTWQRLRRLQVVLAVLITLLGVVTIALGRVLPRDARRMEGVRLTPPAAGVSAAPLAFHRVFRYVATRSPDGSVQVTGDLSERQLYAEMGRSEAAVVLFARATTFVELGRTRYSLSMQSTPSTGRAWSKAEHDDAEQQALSIVASSRRVTPHHLESARRGTPITFKRQPARASETGVGVTVAEWGLLALGSGMIARVVVFVLIAGRRRWRLERQDALACMRCGYRLEGLAHGVQACPECGARLYPSRGLGLGDA